MCVCHFGCHPVVFTHHVCRHFGYSCLCFCHFSYNFLGHLSFGSHSCESLPNLRNAYSNMMEHRETSVKETCQRCQLLSSGELLAATWQMRRTSEVGDVVLIVSGIGLFPILNDFCTSSNIIQHHILDIYMCAYMYLYVYVIYIGI